MSKLRDAVDARADERDNEAVRADAELETALEQLDGYTIGIALGASDRMSLSIEDGDPVGVSFDEDVDDDFVTAVSGRLEAGLGAWRFFYRLGWKPTTDRQVAGLSAMKHALIDSGYGKGIDVEQLIFGYAATARTQEFQEAHGLVADGVIGPNTSRRLMRVYYDIAEARYSIPDKLLARIGYGESNDDPIAEGVVDDEDEGLLQEHLPFQPSLTLAEALTPSYVTVYGGKQLADLHTGTGSWKGAVAAWNIGRTYAKLWVAAGYPTSGGPTMGTDPVTGQPIDSFTRATNYYGYIIGLPF